MLVAPLPSVAHCWGEKASFLELLPFHPSCREMPEKPAFLSLPPCLAHEQRNKQTSHFVCFVAARRKARAREVEVL